MILPGGLHGEAMDGWQLAISGSDLFVLRRRTEGLNTHCNELWRMKVDESLAPTAVSGPL
jgi:hypothetical protein